MQGEIKFVRRILDVQWCFALKLNDNTEFNFRVAVVTIYPVKQWASPNAVDNSANITAPEGPYCAAPIGSRFAVKYTYYKGMM